MHLFTPVIAFTGCSAVIHCLICSNIKYNDDAAPGFYIIGEKQFFAREIMMHVSVKIQVVPA